MKLLMNKYFIVYSSVLFLLLAAACGPTLQQRKAYINGQQMIITQCSGSEPDFRCIREATRYSCGGDPFVMSMSKQLQQEAAKVFGDPGRFYIVGECLYR